MITLQFEPTRTIEGVRRGCDAQVEAGPHAAPAINRRSALEGQAERCYFGEMTTAQEYLSYAADADAYAGQCVSGSEQERQFNDIAVLCRKLAGAASSVPPASPSDELTTQPVSAQAPN